MSKKVKRQYSIWYSGMIIGYIQGTSAADALKSAKHVYKDGTEGSVTVELDK